MKSKKSHRYPVFLVILLAGTALHFLYSLFPSPVTALFAPVDESLFQHAKLLFWPLLAGTFWLSKWDNAPKTPRLWGLLIGIVLMLFAGYVYHVLLGGSAMWVDIVIYCVTMLIAFLAVPRLFRGRECPKACRYAADAAVLIFGFCLILFTFRPPANILFQELEPAGRFFPLPY